MPLRYPADPVDPPMDLTLSHFLLTTGIVLLGATLQAATGFGGGFIVTPLLALVSLELIPGPVIAASMGLSGLMAWRGRRAIRTTGFPTLFTGMAVGALAGVAGLARVPAERLGLLFGTVVLVAVGFTAAGMRIAFNRPNLAVSGTLAGFMGATSGFGAPALALLYPHESGATLRATLAVIYALSSVMTLVMLAVAGRFGAHEALLGVFLLPGFLLGYALAAPMARWLDRGHGQRAMLAMATAGALLLIWRSL